MEIWKDVVGFEGCYQVSNLGRVKSLLRDVVYADGRKYKYPEKVLAPNVNKSGYLYVHLYKNTKRKGERINVLVAKAFLPNPDKLSDVNHINGDKSNNSEINLEWTSRLRNMQHGFASGLINNTGVNHGNNVYTEAQIIQVKQLIVLKMSDKDIENKTGVKKATVSQIKTGKQWKHL